MTINLSEEDRWISQGVRELGALARADIQQAHGEPSDRIAVSPRTQELYPKIVAAIEVDRDENYN